MTTIEFNTKYKDFLEEGHYGLDIMDKEVISYLDDIFKDLTQIPGFKFKQIKLKFGYCKFYSTLCLQLELSIEKQIEFILNKVK